MPPDEKRDAPRRFAAEEPNQDLELAFPTPKRAAVLLGRALTLRCPKCGGGPVMKHWFKMRDRCGQCGLLLERGEKDYFIGSMAANLILGEMLFAAVFVGTLFATWPHPPWDTLQFAAPIGALIAPLLIFPFSKLMWLAADLILRPEKAP